MNFLGLSSICGTLELVSPVAAISSFFFVLTFDVIMVKSLIG